MKYGGILEKRETVNMIQMQPNNNTLIYVDVMKKIENSDVNYAEKFFQLPFFRAENGIRFIVRNIEMHINVKDFWKKFCKSKVNYFTNTTRFLPRVFTYAWNLSSKSFFGIKNFIKIYKNFTEIWKNYAKILLKTPYKRHTNAIQNGRGPITVFYYPLIIYQEIEIDKWE
jgi:hypothetical protein